MVRSLDISCFEGQHLIFMLCVVIPILVFFGLVVPLMISYNIYLYKAKRILKSKGVSSHYEKFTMPYRDSRAFYGILLIFNKIIVVFLKELLIQMSIPGDIMTILLILLFYFVTYCIINRLAKPYKEGCYRELELIEKRLIMIHISNALLASIWISTLDERNKLSGFLILLFVLFSNIIFVFWWFHNYFGYFKAKLTNLYIYIEKILNKFGRKTIQKNQTFLNFKTNFAAFEKKKDLVEIIYKLKLLNSLLIERIKDIELEEICFKPISDEECLE